MRVSLKALRKSIGKLTPDKGLKSDIFSVPSSLPKCRLARHYVVLETIFRGTKIFKKALVISFVVIALAACGNSPGPLEGTWKMTAPGQSGFLIPMTVTFRNGETEALGIIEKVSYKVDGADVLVTYEEGMAKGITIRYTIIGPNSIRTELGTLTRVKR